MNDLVFYFGCYEDKGHYLYRTKGQPVNNWNMPLDFPVAPNSLDGGFLPPKRPQVQGKAEHILLRNWTIVTFWDRSLDKRQNSSSSFVLRGTLTFEWAVKLAREAFPELFERFDFEIVRAGASAGD